MCEPRSSSNKLNFESTARKLLSPSPSDGLRCATDLRERIEIVHTSEYAIFLRFLFPAFRELLLHRLDSDSTVDSIENRFRHVILEILNRLPNNELLRPYTPELLRIATETLARDNEENALTCLRIIFDLHKNFRPALEGEVQAFLDLVRRVYRMLPTSVKKAFRPCLPTRRSMVVPPASIIPFGTASIQARLRPSFAGVGTVLRDGHHFLGERNLAPVNTTTPRLYQAAPLKGLDSFKVLTECPLIVMLLFQLYPRYIQDNIPQLTPLMMGGLALRAPSAAHRQQHDRYRELVACQVKTLSFLTYLLRGFSDLMKPYQDAISESVIALMIACPGDAVATRKELLVATRHILATEFRRGFYGHVNILLDEKVLIGIGRPSQESLRPLAFSTLADLVHHVRSKLNINQLARVVVLFSRNLQDPALPLTVQTTSVRLLLNLVDYIFHNADSNIGRGKSLLVCILRALVAKLETLRWLIVELANKARIHLPPLGYTSSVVSTNSISWSARWNSFKNASSNRELICSMSPPLQNPTPGFGSLEYTDIKALLHTMLRGIKTVLWCVSRYKRVNGEKCTNEDTILIKVTESNRKNVNESSHVFSQQEIDTVSNFFEWGMSCCQLYIHGARLGHLEEKDILDKFAGAFTVLNGYNLRLTVGRHIPLLFTATLRTPQILGVSQVLLANTNASTCYAEALLSYLMKHLDDLAHLNYPFCLESKPLLESGPSTSCGNGACLACASESPLASMVIGCTRFPVANNCAILPSYRASVLLRLFKIVFGSVSLFEGNEVALHGRVQLILLESLRLASSVHRPVGYLLLLRSLFRALGPSCSTDVAKKFNRSQLEIEIMLPVVVNALLQLRRQLFKPRMAHLLVIELCLTLPVRPSAMAATIPYMLEPLTCALKLSELDLAPLALRIFEYYLDHLGTKLICDLLAMQPKLAASFFDAVYSHLRPSPYPYGTLAIRILGKLGGYNRIGHHLLITRSSNAISKIWSHYSLYPHTVGASCMDSPYPSIYRQYPSALTLRCTWYDQTALLGEFSQKVKYVSKVAGGRGVTSPCYSTLLTQVSTVGVLRLQNFIPCCSRRFNFSDTNITYKSRNDFILPLDGCIDAVCGLFHTLLQVPLKKGPRLSGASVTISEIVLDRYCTLCFKFIRSVLSCLIVWSSNPVYALDINDPSTLQKQASNLNHANAQLQTLLGAILSANTNSNLTSQAAPLIDELCLHYATLFACKVLPHTHALSDLSFKIIEEKYRAPKSGDCESLSVYTMNQMLIRTLLDSRLKVQRYTVKVVCRLVECALELEGPLSSNYELRGLALISDLVLRLCHVLHQSSLYAIRGACHALHCLVPILGYNWVQYLGTAVVRSLLYALGDKDVDASIQTVNDVVCALCSIVRSCHNKRLLKSSPIIAMLLHELSSKRPAKRLGAQSALIELNMASGLPPLDPQLFPMHVVCTVVMTALKAFASKSSIKVMIGSLDAIVFLLTTRPPVIPFDYTIQCALLTAVGYVQSNIASESFESICLQELAAQGITNQFGCRTFSVKFCAALSFCSLQFSSPCVSSQGHLLYAVTLRAIHAGVRATSLKLYEGARDVVSLHHQLKILKFALQSVTHQVPIIAASASTLLYDLIATSASLKTEALRSHLCIVLQNSDTPDRDFIHQLNGVEQILLIPASRQCLSDQFSELLFSQLFAWIERLQTMRGQQSGQFLQIASKLLRLITHVPPPKYVEQLTTSNIVSCMNDTGQSWVNSSCPKLVTCRSHSDVYIATLQMISRLVEAVLKLEALVPKYTRVRIDSKKAKYEPGMGSESEYRTVYPFRKALACYLSQHSAIAVSYFLSRQKLILSEYVVLLRAILILPEAAALRCRFASKDGIDLLSEAAFHGASITAKAKLGTKLFAKTQQRHPHAIPDMICDPRYETQASLPTYKSTHGSASNQIQDVDEYHMIPIVLSQAIRPLIYAHTCQSIKDGKQRRPNNNRLAGETGETGETGTLLQSNFTSLSTAALATLQYSGLQILQALQELDPIFIGQHKAILNCLLTIWRGRSFHRDIHTCNNTPQGLAMHDDKEARLIVQCLVSYSRSNPDDVPVLFDVLTVLVHPSPVDFTFLKTFLSDEVASNWVPEHKRAILYFFLRILADFVLSSDIKVLALRFLITPMLVSTFDQKNKSYRLSNIFNSDLIALFMRSALDVADHSTHSSNRYSEALRVELLKLTTVLIEHLGLQLVEHRKELIKFAWNHLKSEGSLSKQWAYVNVCRFIATYETPPKIILQVYVALLRTFQPEARELVKVALDVLVPALPNRLPLPDFIKAIKWTKKIMYEEGHALPQLIHMWQLIIRHPLLFYSYRTQFVPQMVNSLNRLGLPPNCPIENRQLAVALADLIIAWELHHARITANSEPCNGIAVLPYSLSIHQMSCAATKPVKPIAPYNLSGDDFTLSAAMVELLVNFLVRLALFSSDNKEPMVQRLATLCVTLLRVALAVWPKVHIRFSYFEKLIATSYSRPDSLSNRKCTKPHGYRLPLTSELIPFSISLLSTCLDILLATLDVGLKPNSFFIDNVTKAQQLIFPCFDVLHEDIQLKFRRLLVVVSTLYPAIKVPVSSPLCVFYQNLKFTVESFLRNTIIKWNLEASPEYLKRVEVSEIDKLRIKNDRCLVISPTLGLLEAMCEHTSNYIVNHGNSLMQVAQYLATYHLSYVEEQPSRVNVLVATPVMSLLANGIVLRQKDKLSNVEKTSIDDMPSDDSVEALIVCIRVIGKALVSRIVSELRRPFVALLFSCLERSRSLLLISSISVFVSRWVSTTCSPFTRKERFAFLDVLSDMDRLDDMDAYPLMSRFHGIMQRLDTPGKTTPGAGPNVIFPGFAKTKVFAAGLLAPHSVIRFEFRTRLMRWSIDCIGTKLLGLLNTDWTPLSNRFWLVVVVEVLLDSVNLTTSTLTTKVATALEPESLTKYVNHVSSSPNKSSRDQNAIATIICTLKEVTHVNLALAENIFQILVSAAGCNAIARYGKDALGRAISKQLSGTHHSTFMSVPPKLLAERAFAILPPEELKVNIPQILIRVSSLLSLLFVFTPDTLFMMASKYNFQHGAVMMIEDTFTNIRIETKTRSKLDSKQAGLVRLLLAILGQLSEHDLSTVVLQCLNLTKLPKVGAMLYRYDHLVEAQETYFHVIRNSLQQVDSQGVTVLDSMSKPIAVALEFCENEWVRCARELAQWKVLSKIPQGMHKQDLVWPSSNNRLSLALESAWKSQSWDDVKTILNQPTSKIGLGMSSPQNDLQGIRLAVADRRFSEVDALCAHCIDNLLRAWCSLPSPQGSCASHSPLLQLFHELIEIHESGQLLQEAFEHSRTQTHPDLRAIVLTWRHRLPNHWENMLIWDNIMRWREHCFTYVRREFEPWSSPEHVLLLHDSPWTMSTTMRVARKHHFAEAIKLVQMSETDVQVTKMDVDDAFIKLREQILSCHVPMKSNLGHIRRGLHLILNTTMDFFGSKQRAELLRLKGLFFGTMGQLGDAHAAFSAATLVCCFYGRAWFAWAALCESQHRSSTVGNQATLVKYSVVCYLAAVEYGHLPAFVGGIARVLWLLRSNKDTQELGNIVSEKLDCLPSWIWVPWLHQLMAGLLEFEHVVACKCLVRIATVYPQALYYTLRAELRQLESATTHCNLKSQGEILNYVRIVCSQMRVTHSSLTFDMDVLCDELLYYFQPQLHEKLLSLVQVSLMSCYSSLEQLRDLLPARICDKVRAAFLSLESTVCSTKGPFSVKYGAALARDFSIQRTSSVNLHTIICRLIRWRYALEMFPSKSSLLLLSNLSSTLTQLCRRASMKSTASMVGLLEVPGQYSSAFSEPRLDLNMLLFDVGPYFDSKHCSRSIKRHIIFSTDTGQDNSFRAAANQRLTTRVSENSAIFSAVIDHALSHSITAQKRRLRVTQCALFPAGCSLQLLNDPVSSFTLSGIDDLRSASLDIDADAPLLCARQHVVYEIIRQRQLCCSHPSNESSRKAFRAAQLSAYHEVCSTLRGDADTMSRYVRSGLDSAESFWAFRRSFARNLGVQSLAEHFLDVGRCKSSGLKFCPFTASVTINEFQLTNEAYQKETFPGIVPFRLTRNLVALIQPIMVDGVFTLAIGLATLALQLSISEVGGLFQPFCYLFFQNRFIWSPSDKVDDIANTIIRRVRSLAPTLQDSDNESLPLELALGNLVDTAQNPFFVSMMKPTWQPWL